MVSYRSISRITPSGVNSFTNASKPKLSDRSRSNSSALTMGPKPPKSHKTTAAPTAMASIDALALANTRS